MANTENPSEVGDAHSGVLKAAQEALQRNEGHLPLAATGVAPIRRMYSGWPWRPVLKQVLLSRSLNSAAE
jgi:hypothetical protein